MSHFGFIPVYNYDGLNCYLKRWSMILKRIEIKECIIFIKKTLILQAYSSLIKTRSYHFN